LKERKHIDEAGLVDTNILVYMADATESSKHEKAKKFLNKIIDNPELYLISLQNLREFCAVMIGKKKIKDKELEQYFILFQSSFEEVIYDTPEDVLFASKITLNKNNHFWDSLLAQTMKRNQVRYIYTENINDFKKFDNVTAINPLE